MVSLRNLLIIKPSSLGDIVHGLLVAEALRQQVPEVRIDWVVRDRFAGLLERCPTVDRLLLFQREQGLRGILATARAIRAERYEAVLDLQGLLRSGLMTGAARAPRKLGRSDAREGSRLFYRTRVPLPAAGKRSHAVAILAEFLPALGLAIPERWPPLPFRLDEEKLPLAPPDPIVLFPGSRRPEKEWPFFAELTQHLLEDGRGPVVWASDTRLETPAWLRGREGLLNRTGQSGWDEFLGLIQQARLVVCNDSGPMHIAAAMGKPLVTLFGPTDPALYGPFPPGRPGQTVLRSPDRTMAGLPVEDVLRAITKA